MGIRARTAAFSARASSSSAASSAVKSPNNACSLRRLPKRCALGCGFPSRSSRSMPICLHLHIKSKFLNAASAESGICLRLLPGGGLAGFWPGNNPPINGKFAANPATLLAVERIMLSFMGISLFISFLSPEMAERLFYKK